MINFLMNSGKPVSTEVADTLHDTAKEMFRKRKDRLKFKSRHCEGVMSTEGKRASMGTLAGIEFEATMSVDGADTTVKFIIADNFLEAPKGEWVGAHSEAEMLELIERDALHDRPSRLN